MFTIFFNGAVESYIHRSDNTVGSGETIIAVQAQKLSALEAKLEAAESTSSSLQSSIGEEKNS